jgi:hypothetical protein
MSFAGTRKAFGTVHALTFTVTLMAVTGSVRAALVGRWSFDDGTANDTSGNGNNGMLLGSATIVNDPVRGQVLSLTNSDADNDGDGKVDLGSPTSLNLMGQMSVAAWIKADALPAPPGALALRNILNRGHGTPAGLPQREFTFRIDATRPDPNALVTNYDIGQWQTGIGDQHATAVIPVEDLGQGNWVHLAGTGTQEGANFIWRLYRNGELINTSMPFTDSMRDMTGVGWAIGGRGGIAATTFERGFLGMIDDVRIYNHPLTVDEIAQIINPGPPLVPGDTDGNGTVNIADFEPIRANFRKAVTARTDGDLVRNGVVDFDDFHQWKGAFLGAGGSLAGLNLSFADNVPEPSSWLLWVVIMAIAPVQQRVGARA